MAAAFALAVTALPASAQTNWTPPPPVAVGQSDPGFGPLTEARSALLAAQAAISQHRREHNGKCTDFDSDDAYLMQWCQSNARKIEVELDGYSNQLKRYKADQVRYQGRTLYLRKDYAGAIGFYQEAVKIGGYTDELITELDLARARQAEQNGDLELARSLMCGIDAREASKPGWISTELAQLFGQIKSWMMRYGKRFEVRTPTCALAVRG